MPPSTGNPTRQRGHELVTRSVSEVMIPVRARPAYRLHYLPYSQLAARLADDLNVDEQDTQDFGSLWELFLRSVFEAFVAGFSSSFLTTIFLPLAFQISKYIGRKISGEYQMLLTTAVSKRKTCFSVCQKNVGFSAKVAP
jgi:hypothetical protein